MKFLTYIANFCGLKFKVHLILQMGRRKRKELNHFVCPSIQYYKQASLCQKVRETYFTMIEDDMVIKCHVITEVSKMFKMPRNTLVEWVKKWKINQFYRVFHLSVASHDRSKNEQ